MAVQDAVALSAANAVVLTAGELTGTVAGDASLSAGGEFGIHTDANATIRADGNLETSATIIVEQATEDIRLSAGEDMFLTAANLTMEVDNLNSNFTGDYMVSTAGNIVFTAAINYSLSTGGSWDVSVGSSANVEAASLSVASSGDFDLSVSGDSFFATEGNLSLSTAGDLHGYVGKTFDLQVVNELSVSGGETTLAFANTGLIVTGNADVGVTGAVDVSVFDALDINAAVVAIESTSIGRTTTISTAGSLETTVDGPRANLIVEGSIVQQAKTGYALAVTQGAVSVGASTTVDVFAGTTMSLAASSDASMSVGGAMTQTTATTHSIVAQDLNISVSNDIFVEGDSANIHLVDGGFEVSATQAIDIATVADIHMVAPAGLYVDALAGVSVGATTGAGNLVVNNDAGIHASTDSSNINIYSTNADGPAINLSSAGGSVMVPSALDIKVKGVTGTMDLSVNEATFTNDVVIRGDLRVLGSQFVEGSVTEVQTGQLVIEDRTIEIGVHAADTSNTVIQVSNIAALGDFSVAEDLATLSGDLLSSVKFPATEDDWRWFRPYDFDNSPSGNTYFAAAVDANVDVDSIYGGREVFVRTPGLSDLGNGIVYDSFITYAAYEKSFPYSGANVVIFRTSGSIFQPDGANVDGQYSNSFLYGIQGDYTVKEWDNDANVGFVSDEPLEISIKYHSDALAHEGGILLRANKTESIRWYKASGSQSTPYWRLTSDLMMGGTNAFHFADKGNESTAHWFMKIDETTGSFMFCYGSVNHFLIGASFDVPIAI